MTKRVRAGFMLMAAVAMMGLAGCGHYICSQGANFGSSSCSSSGGGGGLNGNGVVYAYLLSEVGASDGMAADTLSLSANTFTEASSFVAPPLPLGLPLDGGTVVVNLATQKYLYVPFNNGTVYGYAIDGTTGALTSVPGSPYAVAGGNAITSTPAGTFLFVGDSVTGDISAFSISATDGSLTALGSFSSGIAVAQIATDGQGKYLYATTGTGGAQVAAMTIDQSTGALTPLPTSPFFFSMSKVLGENSGGYLLGITGFNNNIHVFTIDSIGAIAEATSSPFATAALPTNLVVHPTGNFVYALDGLSTPMEGYDLNVKTGALTRITGSPFTGVNLDQGQFDQSGKYLFGVAEGSVAIDFGPYGTDTSTGVISAPTFGTLGFPGGGFAVSDLNDAP